MKVIGSINKVKTVKYSLGFCNKSINDLSNNNCNIRRKCQYQEYIIQKLLVFYEKVKCSDHRILHFVLMKREPRDQDFTFLSFGFETTDRIIREESPGKSEWMFLVDTLTVSKILGGRVHLLGEVREGFMEALMIKPSLRLGGLLNRWMRGKLYTI